jgi:hypothetical protein
VASISVAPPTLTTATPEAKRAALSSILLASSGRVVGSEAASLSSFDLEAAASRVEPSPVMVVVLASISTREALPRSSSRGA